MTLRPQEPVGTGQDNIALQARKRDKKLTAQRQRRATNRRIDYYPSEEAAAVIDGMTNHKQIEGVYSRVIDRLILSAITK